jgi:hypothetical protein
MTLVIDLSGIVRKTQHGERDRIRISKGHAADAAVADLERPIGALEHTDHPGLVAKLKDKEQR